MTLKRYPLSHKSWYLTLIFFVNCLIPCLLLTVRVLKTDFTVILYIAMALLPLLFLSAIVYTWATMREYRVCLRLIKKDAALYFKRFIIGMGITWISIFFAFITIALGIKCIDASPKWLGIVEYISASITAILAVISNVFLNLFESRMGFDLFRKKYENTLMKDIASSIAERRRVLKGGRK